MQWDCVMWFVLNSRLLGPMVSYGISIHRVPKRSQWRWLAPPYAVISWSLYPPRGQSGTRVVPTAAARCSLPVIVTRDLRPFPVFCRSSSARNTTSGQQTEHGRNGNLKNTHPVTINPREYISPTYGHCHFREEVLCTIHSSKRNATLSIANSNINHNQTRLQTIT